MLLKAGALRCTKLNRKQLQRKKFVVLRTSCHVPWSFCDWPKNNRNSWSIFTVFRVWQQKLYFFSTKYTNFQVHVVTNLFFFPSNQWCFRKEARRQDLYPYRFPPSLWSVREIQCVATWLRHKFGSYLSVWSHWINFCFRWSTSRLWNLLRDNLVPQLFQSHLPRLRFDRLLGPRTRSKKKSHVAILLKA